MIVRTCGALRSENAGVSSEKTGENPVHRLTKVSRGRLGPLWVSRVLS